ncbi:MAG: class I poly(R)-hydroxyalkanoic acid synthase, partial [Halomonas sp.]
MFQQGVSQEDIEAWNTQLKEAAEQYQGLMQDLLARMAPSEAADSVYSDMRKSFEAGAQALMNNPTLLWQTQARLLQDQWLLWQQSMRALSGEQVTPLITPSKGDRRFKDDAWTQDPQEAASRELCMGFSQVGVELV